MTRQRILLPLGQWPERDRRAWEALFRQGNLLDGRGAGAHWAPATRRTYRTHYARWLGDLSAVGELDDAAAPRERVTPERVEAFVRRLRRRVRPRTVASAVIGLKCVLRAMQPQGDWRWLKDLTNRLDAWAQPSREDRGRLLPAAEIFGGLLETLERLSAGPLATRRQQLDFRNALLCAVLLACPVRERNVAMMRIGRHLSRAGDEWHLRFEPGETKTRHPIHLVLPREYEAFLDTYLRTVRPQFPRADEDDHLWPACKGKPMAGATIYAAVGRCTGDLFGVALAPHDFRSIAATFLAESSPEDAQHARPLLGHRQPGTTERYYIRARQLEASRVVTSALRSIRDG